MKNIRHKANKNLIMYFDSSYTAYTAYRGLGYNSLIKRRLPVFQYDEEADVEKGLFIKNLNSCLHVINKALEEHPRTLAIRVDLRVPGFVDQLPDNAISSFMESFKAKIKQDRLSAALVKPCKVHYIWVRERGSSRHDHFHVLLLLNKDAYPSLGSFNSENKNLASRIKESWVSALGIDMEDLGGGVFFPDNAEYMIEASQEPDYRLCRLIESDRWPLMEKGERSAALSDFNDCYEGLFYRVSYFCKANTKVFGRDLRSFGCSLLKR